MRPARTISVNADWQMFGGELAFMQTTGGIPIDSIIAASKGTPMGDRLEAGETDKRALMGCLWDCAVAIRERMVMPAMPQYAAISLVNKALLKHLGEDQYEKFLRPTGSVGLPPSSS